jgi:hypothetical protein
MPDDGEPVAHIEDYQPKRRFRPVRFKDIRLDPGRPYLVKGLIPREGLTVVWGPPKCGKSFWTFDLVAHVALGWGYRGRRIHPGTVVYVACEGERGLGARTEAFRVRHLAEDDASDPPFFLLTTRLDLVADIEELIGDIRAEIGTDRCAAVCIDTLNRSISGSESRDEDMGAYVKAADRIREAFHAAVIIIHHCGLNGERPRGHTSLTGAVDAQIAVKRENGNIVATVECMKDGAEGEAIVSRLAVIEVGTDEDGEAITSCVIEPADGGPKGAKAAKRLPDAAKIGLDTLRKAVTEAGSEPPASTINHIPPTARVIDVETWRRFHYAGTASDEQTPDARRKTFQRVRTQLQAAGVIGLHTDLIWVCADV